uniref:Large ribosomal subunit protein uL18 n=1 Tax=Desulfomonile tiedjei TaxID=2358 RepID=A0A7C4ESS4_9BACT
MAGDTDKILSRAKRTKRIRHKLMRQKNRPRLTVFRSNRNIYAQIIDDQKGETIVQASTLDKDFRRQPGQSFDKALSREVGRRIAARAIERNITEVVFDRGPYLYHGKVKALADGAREGGLIF